jgi:hypothetical protein
LEQPLCGTTTIAKAQSKKCYQNCYQIALISVVISAMSHSEHAVFSAIQRVFKSWSAILGGLKIHVSPVRSRSQPLQCKLSRVNNLGYLPNVGSAAFFLEGKTVITVLR